MGQNQISQGINHSQYQLLKQYPNGCVLKQKNNQSLHFLKQYSFTNQQAYQEAFVKFSKKLPDRHQHILYLQKATTKLQNTFCSTIYKVSLLYQYVDNNLWEQICVRSKNSRIFDQKQVWSILCSCILAICEMIRLEGRCHSALSPLDIKITNQGIVKILALQMAGMNQQHDLNNIGTTQQLACTIISCFTLQKLITKDEQMLAEFISSLQVTAQMKKILSFMISPNTKFIDIQEYLFKIVQDDTDSFNSYSHTPANKQKISNLAFQSIPQDSKEDDAVFPLIKDLEDNPESIQNQMINTQKQIPDQNQQPQDTNENSPKIESKVVSPQKYKHNNEPNNNTLFTDPKILNLIYNDLQQIKKRKSITMSRKSGLKSQQSQKKIQVQKLQKKREKTQITENNQKRQLFNKLSKVQQKNIKQSSRQQFQSVPSKKMNLYGQKSTLRQFTQQYKSQTLQTKSNKYSNQQISKRKDQKKQILSSVSNELHNKNINKKYENIMDMEQMGFKKNKKQIQSKQNDTIAIKLPNYSQKQNQNKIYIEQSLNSFQSSKNNSHYKPNSNYQSSLSQSNAKLSSSQAYQKQTDLEYTSQTYLRGRYQGTKYKNMRHGKGTFYYNEGGKYVGQWKLNKMNGKGVLYYPNNTVAYDGEWKDDQLQGKGILYNEQVNELTHSFDYRNWQDVDEYWQKYEGLFESDTKNGMGRLYLSNGEIFQGMFKDDMIWGQGIFYKNDGSRIKGIWKQNKLIKNL